MNGSKMKRWIKVGFDWDKGKYEVELKGSSEVDGGWKIKKWVNEVLDEMKEK